MKILSKFVLTLLISITMLAGCSGLRTASKGPSASTLISSNGIESMVESLSYNSGKGIYTPGIDPSAAIKAEGKPLSVFTAPSCALPGNDTTYTYSGFSLLVNENDGTKTLVKLYFTDDSRTTERGLFIGSPESDIKKMYGDLDKIDHSYIFIKGSTKLIFVVTDGTVSGIEYTTVD